MGCTFRAKQLEDRGGLEEVEKLGQKTSDEKRERETCIHMDHKQTNKNKYPTQMMLYFSLEIYS